MYMVKNPLVTISSAKIPNPNEADPNCSGSTSCPELSQFNSSVATLLHKIDRIEQSQGQVVAGQTKIQEAIYDPDDGIFAKLAAQKLESYQQFSQLGQQLAAVNTWKQYQENSDDDRQEKADKAAARVNEIAVTVDSMTKRRKLFWDVSKWIMVAMGGGGITLAFKYVGQYIFGLH